MDKTPKSNRTLNSVGSSSPVQGVNIYAGRSAPGHSGNLTGNARLLKDIVAEVFNCMQQWKLCQDNVCVDISNIYNYRIRCPDVRFSDKIQDLVRKLKNSCDKMDDIITELDIKQKNALAVVELENYNSKRLQTNRPSLFISWSTEKFYQTIEKIVKAYSDQHKLHQSLLPRIADGMDSDDLLFYLLCWTFHPYLDDDIEKQMHYMIKETRLN